MAKVDDVENKVDAEVALIDGELDGKEEVTSTDAPTKLTKHSRREILG